MRTQLLLLAPLIAPLTAAGVAAIGRRSRVVQRSASVAALAVVVVAGVLLTRRALRSGVVHTSVGADGALAGIALTADPFGAAAATATGLLAVVVVSAMWGTSDDHHPLLHPVLLILIGGSCGSFLAGDLFNLFVLFEVVLIASYVMLVLRSGFRQLRAGIVYITANLIGTVLLLTGVAAVFAATGTVNLALLAEQSTGPGAMPGAVLLLIAFALKAGLLPFSGWLVVGYPATQRTTMALFAGTLTTLGIAALYRVVLLGFGDSEVLRTATLVAAAATLALTALAAIAATDHDRVLALVITTQVGFMAVGFGLGTTAGVAAGVFFVLQDVLVKATIVLAYLFLHLHRSRVMGGVAAASFAVLALSLVGFPPLSGFVGKMLIMLAAVEDGAFAVVAAMLVSSALTLAALLPLWQCAIQEGGRTNATTERWPRPNVGVAAVAAVVVGVVAVGIAPGGLLTISNAAAEVLVDPAGYAQEVLGS
ncbi:complex I subunit 5 family protein [Salinifilum ghardaiensis]